MKKIKIDMFQEYVSKLIFRCCVFLVVLLAYLFEPDYFDLILTKKVEMQWLLSGGRSITASWSCTAMFKKIIWRRSGCCWSG